MSKVALNPRWVLRDSTNESCCDREADREGDAQQRPAPPAAATTKATRASPGTTSLQEHQMGRALHVCAKAVQQHLPSGQWNRRRSRARGFAWDAVLLVDNR